MAHEHIVLVVEFDSDGYWYVESTTTDDAHCCACGQEFGVSNMHPSDVVRYLCGVCDTTSRRDNNYNAYIESMGDMAYENTSENASLLKAAYEVLRLVNAILARVAH